MQLTENNLVAAWVVTLQSERTREAYLRGLKRYLDVSHPNPEQVLLEAKSDMKMFPIRSKADASKRPKRSHARLLSFAVSRHRVIRWLFPS